jgi:hypothetical protein
MSDVALSLQLGFLTQSAQPCKCEGVSVPLVIFIFFNNKSYLSLTARSESDTSYANPWSAHCVRSKAQSAKRIAKKTVTGKG